MSFIFYILKRKKLRDKYNKGKKNYKIEEVFISELKWILYDD